MKKELNYFNIGDSLGGRQDWLTEPVMRLGGCAALCACESSIYFSRFCGLPEAYPFDVRQLTKESYLRFAMSMKPYLRPRLQGINRPQIYIDGFSRYLGARGVTEVEMETLPGDAPAEQAQAALLRQIDAGLPVPCLLLRHEDPAFSSYEWHWFMLTGYDTAGGGCLAKAVTYGGYRWLSLPALWDTRRPRRGGLILYRLRRPL